MCGSLTALIVSVFRENTLHDRELSYGACLWIKHFVHLVEFNILNVHFDSLCLYHCYSFLGSFLLWGTSAFLENIISILPGVFCFILFECCFCSNSLFELEIFLINHFAHFYNLLKRVQINLVLPCLSGSNFAQILVTLATLMSQWYFSKFSLISLLNGGLW